MEGALLSLLMEGKQPMKHAARQVIDNAVRRFAAHSRDAVAACYAARNLLTQQDCPLADATFLKHYDAATAPRLSSTKVKAAMQYIGEVRAKPHGSKVLTP